MIWEEKPSWSEPELFLNPPPLLATFLFGFENLASQLYLDPSFIPVNLPDGRRFLKGTFSKASAVRLPGGKPHYYFDSLKPHLRKSPADLMQLEFLLIA